MPLVVHIAAALAGAGLLLAGWMLLVEPRFFRVRRVALRADECGLGELRMLQVTDTHFHGRDEHILGFLRRLAERERLDLVLYTGDLIDTAEGVESLRRAAALFRPTLGSFAVLGGHDYRQIGYVRPYWHLLTGVDVRRGCRHNPSSLVRDALESCGVTVLSDSSTVVSAGNGPAFAVVGLRDAYEFRPDYEAAWADVPDDMPVLAIAHCPDVLPEVSRRGARLAFFGHTHGGQVRFPFIGAVVTRSRLPRELARGTFAHNGTIFIVNNGLGTSPATPYRLLCRPEAVIVELRADAPHPNAAVREVQIG